MEQRLAEARAALAQLRGFGVTTIHDITSAEQLAVYQELRHRGELTVRVYARPALDRWEHLAALGIRHGFGDDWIKIGGLKGYVDGIMGNSSARFYEPYLTTGERGSWRPMMEPPGNLEKLLRGADADGQWPQIHAIGDEAIDTLLDLYEKVMAANGPRDPRDPRDHRERRFRVIHAQVLRGPEVARRMARLGLIAEVQPYHAVDDIRWMEPRIGARARWAYAFKTLQDAGVRLCFGSDWPGTNASWYPADPVLGLYAAVTRQTVDGTPAGGWFPQERIDLETALRAYTVNNAWAAGEEELKGRLAPGLLADLVVLNRDPFAVPSEGLKAAQGGADRGGRKDRVRRSYRSVSSGKRLFQVGLFHVHEPMAQHVDCGLALLQRDVAQERLVQAVARIHVQEQNLAVDRVRTPRRGSRPGRTRLP